MCIISQDLEVELKQVYSRMSKLDDFPKSYCSEVSRELEELGLEPQWGWFVLDFPMPDWPYDFESHTWSKTEEGIYIDLTAHQFNSGLEKPLSPGVLIVAPDSALRKRYDTSVRFSH